MNTRSWILTDVVHDIWMETFAISNMQLNLSSPHGWSVKKRTLRGGRRDGIDVIEVHNGDLAFSILPTRGMGLWRGEYHGNFLGWHAPFHGPVHPEFVDQSGNGGLGWLAGFDEWLCRCGLAFNGPPGEDRFQTKSGQEVAQNVTLHGRIANTPAHFVEVRVSLEAPHEISVIGHVEEGHLFGGRLHLCSMITTVPGSNRLVIHDTIENRSAQPAESQLLYHCNLGGPFLEAGSRVVAPFEEMSPLTPRAAEGMDTYEVYASPTVGFQEQVYCYKPMANSNGESLAMLYNKNGHRGFVVRYNTKSLPCFTVWKNTGALEDGYVTGLEPATNYPNFRNFERSQGRVVSLPPGGKYETNLILEVFDTKAGVDGVLQEIAQLQARGKTKVHRQPQAHVSALAQS